jgi:hypothetical protein
MAATACAFMGGVFMELCPSIKTETKDFMYKEKLPALVIKTQKLPLPQ